LFNKTKNLDRIAVLNINFSPINTQTLLSLKSPVPLEHIGLNYTVEFESPSKCKLSPALDYRRNPNGKINPSAGFAMYNPSEMRVIKRMYEPTRAPNIGLSWNQF